jgi:hypothetical protein
MNSNFEFSTLQEIAQDAIDKLNDGIGSNCYGCDLHNELFNTDYYIIGYYQAEQWLIKNGGVFRNIQTVQDYEKDNFGEINTDIGSSEGVVNMVVYIAGEIVLGESETLRNNWNVLLSDDDIKNIISELKYKYNI